MVFGDPITMLSACQERRAPIHDKKIDMMFCGRQAGAALQKVRQEMRALWHKT